MSKQQTPMMQQYEAIKAEHQDELLFFRLGDFYELFFDDALIASRELNITLTGRAAGAEDKAPMCGVPYHAAESYIVKLVQKGYKVAVCEQMEDPKAVKGIVKREVVRIITPGTILSDSGVEDSENNFLAVYYEGEKGTALIYSDISTGEAFWSFAETEQATDLLMDTLAMYRPAEIILAKRATLPETVAEFVEYQLAHTVLSPFRSEQTEAQLLVAGENYFNIPSHMPDDAGRAIGYLLEYLQRILKTDVKHMYYLQEISATNRMILDNSCLRHLELSRNLRDGSSKGTLLAVLNHTVTPMGARLLKQWIESPLLDIKKIEARQQAVGELVENPIVRERLRDVLACIFDFERIITRIETGSVSPRDFTSLRESLAILPQVKAILQTLSSPLLEAINAGIGVHEDVHTLLTKAIAEEPALTLKDGRVIRDGYNAELDELRSLATNSRKWLEELETDIKEKTGIKLKTGYNKVFGYYFEVTNTHKEGVPDYFIRKQTLANAERYITPELKEFEIKILSAKDKIVFLEQKLYQEIRNMVQPYIRTIQDTARELAALDVLLSLAQAAYEEHYIRPVLTNTGRISIKDGRHPVIEKFLQREIFVPNDFTSNHEGEEFLLITGPNMAGKSTYMRQSAILLIMAQMGSFIPAREATISPVDRIFTRVGASDDISTGQSTFMVEMKEVAYILANATKNSFIILDEIGRGTSTFDGVSIAQAVVEHIVEHIHAKTMFATHYHELTPLADKYTQLKNYTVAVKERGKDIVFLRRIIPGAADKSYGIHVAKLAGLPKKVLERSQTVLDGLEQGASQNSTQVGAEPVRKAGKAESTAMSFDLFENSLIDDLLAIDVLSTSPIEALNILYRLQEEARKGGGKL